MSQLAELERVKRRRLQEAYADLRPSGKGDDDRQAKLRNLLLGAAADAGIPTGISPPGTARGGSGSAAGSSTGVPQSVRALAAAAAASIAGVESTTGAKRKGGCGIGSPGGSGRTGHAYDTSTLSGGRRRGPDGAAAVRAPPPGPMDGGFLPETDPITRLSQLPVSVAAVGSPPAVGRLAGVGRSGVGTAGAGAAAAQWRGVYDDDDDDDGGGGDAAADVPSDVELALMALKSDLRCHPAAADLPPLALRSQLSCLLADRSSVERQLDEQRRANRVRVFKLPTGTDEFGILSTSDYRALVRQAADDAAAAAAAAAQQQQQQQQQTTTTTTAAAAPASGAYGMSAAAAARPGAAGSRWHAAAEAFLRRVVDHFTDFELSRDHLFHLLRTAPPPPPPPPPPTTITTAKTTGQPSQPPHGGRPAGQRPGAGPAAAAAVSAAGTPDLPPLEAVEEQVSLLLHLGCIARHTDGDADAYVLAVPGVGKLVKAVLGGRRELLTWLSKRQHQEAPEEQIRKLKLRSSCLPPLYLVQELVGRGAARRLDATSGPVVRLTPGSRRG